MALIQSKQIASINLAQLANLASVADKDTPIDADFVVIGDSADSNNVKRTSMDDFVENYIEQELNAHKVAVVTGGLGNANFTFDVNQTGGAGSLVLSAVSTKGKIMIPPADNADIDVIPHGNGRVKVGEKGIISNGSVDLVLKTGNATTGSIEIEDGAAGAISLKTNGAGKVLVGSGANDAELTSSGNHDLILKSGNATTGLIQIIDGAGSNINIHPNGSGTVDVGSKKITNLANPTDDADAANKVYVDSLVHGIRWFKPVKVATTAELNTNAAGVVYTDNLNELKKASNGALGNIDGSPLVFNATESLADRILVKDQDGTKGFLQFSVDTVPAAGETMLIEMGDLYYQVNFVDGATGTSWGGGNGGASNARKTIDVERNGGGESESTIAAKLRTVFNLEPDITSPSAANEVVRLDQTNPKDQAVTNAVAGTAGSDNKSAGAGVSSHNGIYYAHTQGDGSSPWKLVRASDADNGDDLDSAAVFVEEGLTQADQGYVQILPVGGADAIDNDHQSWGQFTGLGQITAELPIKKVGNNLEFNIDEAGALTVHQADLFILADADDSNKPKKLSLEGVSTFQAGGSEFAQNGGVFSLVNNTIAPARLTQTTAGFIPVGKGASAVVYEAPKTLSEAANSGLSMSTYDPTGGANVADLKLDHVVQYAKYDGSAGGGVSTVGSGDAGTSQANTWKVTNIASVGDKAALAQAHPMANQVFFFRNGVLDETLMGLTNKFGAAIDGDDQFTFFNDGSQLNLLIADGNTDKTHDDHWGLDDIAVMFTHMA